MFQTLDAILIAVGSVILVACFFGQRSRFTIICGSVAAFLAILTLLGVWRTGFFSAAAPPFYPLTLLLAALFASAAIGAAYKGRVRAALIGGAAVAPALLAEMMAGLLALMLEANKHTPNHHPPNDGGWMVRALALYGVVWTAGVLGAALLSARRPSWLT